MIGQEKHLDHRAAGEGVHHGAGRRLHFGGRLPHLDARDPFDLLSQAVGGTREELAMILLHLGRSRRIHRKGLLGGR